MRRTTTVRCGAPGPVRSVGAGVLRRQRASQRPGQRCPLSQGNAPAKLAGSSAAMGGAALQVGGRGAVKTRHVEGQGTARRPVPPLFQTSRPRTLQHGPYPRAPLASRPHRLSLNGLRPQVGRRMASPRGAGQTGGLAPSAPSASRSRFLAVRLYRTCYGATSSCFQQRRRAWTL